ncbi:hypothetical protein KCU92_g247, partial [Aureobasidium melanogenum]
MLSFLQSLEFIGPLWSPFYHLVRVSFCFQSIHDRWQNKTSVRQKDLVELFWSMRKFTQGSRNPQISAGNLENNMYQLEDVKYDASKRIHARSRTCNARTRKPRQTGRPLFVMCRKPILGFEPGV